jgi:osmotically-inducible protein OsmY
MMTTGLPRTDRSLQARVEAAVERWIRPCYTASCEHIAVSANDQGEVWLSGLVADPLTVEEAVRLIRGMLGVRYVFNYVTVMITPQQHSNRNLWQTRV